MRFFLTMVIALLLTIIVLADEKSDKALLYLNSIMEASGLIPFTYNATLEKAALNHAKYIYNNKTVGHGQQQGKIGFTGERVGQRAGEAGYYTTQVSENLSAGQTDSKESIDELFTGIYHRFGFLNFKFDEMGIGIYGEQKTFRGFVFNMGNKDLNKRCKEAKNISSGWQVCQDKNKKLSSYEDSFDTVKAKNPPFAIFPAKNATDIRTVFFKEYPHPLPGSKVSGNPITINFNSYYIKSATVNKITVTNSKGKNIQGKLLHQNNDPNKKIKPLQFAFMPTLRFEFGERYNITIDYQVDSKDTFKGQLEQPLKSHFTTRVVEGKIYYLDDYSEEDDILVVSGEKYTIYAKPKSNTDVPFIEGVQPLDQPKGLKDQDIIIRDANLLTVSLTGDIGVKYPIELIETKRKINFVIAKEDKAKQQTKFTDNKAQIVGEQKKVAILYKKGWNFLTTPIDKPISRSRIDKEGSYNMEQLGDGKHVYVMQNGQLINYPENITVGQGFMLYSNKDGATDKITGKAYTFNKQIQKGWNFFGVSVTVNNLQQDLQLTDKDTIFSYDNGKYIKNPTTIQAGTGFFIIRE